MPPTSIQTPLDVKHAIEKADSSQAAIARACNVSRTMVNLVIWHGVQSRKVHRAIARTIEQPVEKVARVLRPAAA